MTWLSFPACSQLPCIDRTRLRSGQNYRVRVLGVCEDASYPTKDSHLESVGSPDRWTVTASFVVPIVPNPMQRPTLTWQTLPRKARRKFLKTLSGSSGGERFLRGHQPDRDS